MVQLQELSYEDALANAVQYLSSRLPDWDGDTGSELYILAEYIADRESSWVAATNQQYGNCFDELADMDGQDALYRLFDLHREEGETIPAFRARKDLWLGARSASSVEWIAHAAEAALQNISSVSVDKSAFPSIGVYVLLDGEPPVNLNDEQKDAVLNRLQTPDSGALYGQIAMRDSTVTEYSVAAEILVDSSGQAYRDRAPRAESAVLADATAALKAWIRSSAIPDHGIERSQIVEALVEVDGAFAVRESTFTLPAGNLPRIPTGIYWCPDANIALTTRDLATI